MPVADNFKSSIKCGSCEAVDNLFTGYNSISSSTYRPNTSSFEIDYGTMGTFGIVSQDILHFDGLQIEDQLVQEPTKLNDAGPLWDNISIYPWRLGCDAFQHRVEHVPNSNYARLLDCNVFGLRLAEPGELMISGINRDLFTGAITRVLVTNETSSFSSQDDDRPQQSI